MTVLETERFLIDTRALLPEWERAGLVTYLAAHPESGEVIPGTGGVRKLRWGLPGRGKRGGARIVYLLPQPASPALSPRRLREERAG